MNLYVAEMIGFGISKHILGCAGTGLTFCQDPVPTQSLDDFLCCLQGGESLVGLSTTGWDGWRRVATHFLPDQTGPFSVPFPEALHTEPSWEEEAAWEVE